MKLENTQQIGHLQDLSNTYSDFKVAKAGRKSDGSMFWTKHLSVLECWETEKGLKFLGEVNNRQILTHEIVIDLDNNPTEEEMNAICDELEEKYCLKYRAYHTGSKGYHIHIYDYGFRLEKKRFSEILINQYKGDVMKIYDNTMIALEESPHWKTGNKKILLRKYK